MTAPTTLDRSWLVQRLEKPRTGGVLGPDNPFAFGGGLVNGGLSKEAMSLLRGIFSFDYMGAAEFEFGAVPQALQGLAKDADRLAVHVFDIALAEVARDWRDKSKTQPKGSATIYVLCRTDDEGEIEARVRTWAKEGFASRLKEPTHLDNTLRPVNEWDGRTVGWLELDNGFFFFTDREMWQQTAALFGVQVTA